MPQQVSFKLENSGSPEPGRKNRKRFFLLFCLLFVVACSTKTRQLFFDIPPPSEEEIQVSEEADRASSSTPVATDPLSWSGGFSEIEERPALESVLDWEKAQEQLPEHELGGVNWTEALSQGIIQPRTGPDPSAALAAAFKYDFIIEAEKPKFNAYFPHSAHTEWLGCQNCHTQLFPYRRNPITMKEMRRGASCGACHGSVAFSTKQCKRCHISM